MMQHLLPHYIDGINNPHGSKKIQAIGPILGKKSTVLLQFISSGTAEVYHQDFLPSRGKTLFSVNPCLF